jgi:predicted nucleic-acid-binding Zn-ribbon protein
VPLSHEQAHKLQEWMDSRGVNRNCPMCGSGEWETGEIVSGTSVDGSGNVLPMAQLVCQNCGYEVPFAAMPIGLI